MAGNSGMHNGSGSAGDMCGALCGTTAENSILNEFEVSQNDVF